MMIANAAMMVLEDQWVREDSSAIAAGDASEITRLLAEELDQIAEADGGWRKLYLRRTDRTLWQLDYPNGDMHGGGPRRLLQLDFTDPAGWK